MTANNRQVARKWATFRPFVENCRKVFQKNPLQSMPFSVIFKKKEMVPMDLPKLLIADDGDEFRQALADALSKSYIVRTCRSGNQALELLRSFRPDIVVTDLMLSELDGLTMLQMATDAGIRPKILVTASQLTPYVQCALDRLQVDYTMRKPCSIQAVKCRLADFSAELAPLPPSSYDPEDLTANILLHLGLGAHLDGFRYLLTAIPLYIHDPNQGITKELYRAVADVYQKDPRQVERSIRSAIDSAWRRRSDKVWAEYFTAAPDGSVPHQSNGRFIGQLAQLLMRKMGTQHAC
jgi:two-component system response regulator (stage 0 sporulation protein A)